MKTNRRTLSRILRRLRLPLVFLSLFAGVVSALATLSVPVLAGRALDVIALSPIDFSALTAVLLRIGGAATVAGLASWMMAVFNQRIAFSFVEDTRNEAFAHLQKLPLSYFDGHPHGDTVSRLLSDTDQISEGLLLGFSQVFVGIVTVIGTVAFMFSIHPVVALLVVFLTPLSLFGARFIAKRIYRLFGNQAKDRASETALLDEAVRGARVLLAFGQEEKTVAAFNEANNRLAKSSLLATFFSSLVNPTTRFLNSIVYAAVAVAGSFTVLAGGMTVGGLGAFLAYATQYTKPFNEISEVLSELQNTMACADRVFAFLDTEEEKDDGALPALPSNPRKIAFSNVSFSYSPDKPLIENLSLTVHAGQKIAIVGPTGCGKTTLINLLMRFYDVNEGCITFDGKNAENATRASLRSQFGMVLQDTWLRHGTVRDNIALSCPAATDEEVEEAARLAFAHSFIKRLPNGYQTVLAEGGEGLSAGQKQLLCIARVMLKKPPMLILDEATSSIDTRTEVRVQKAFDTLMEGRTTFIVAHRLSTVKNADCILVMKDGHIIEQGKHEELLSHGGFYAELFNSQFACE